MVEIKYSCSALKYDPGDGTKPTSMLIVDFDVEEAVFSTVIKNELLCSFIYFPFKADDFIYSYFGERMEFWTDFTTEVAVKIISRNHFQLLYLRKPIQGYLSNDQLSKWGVKSIQEFFEGNVDRRLILTNFQYGTKTNTKISAYDVRVSNILI